MTKLLILLQLLSTGVDAYYTDRDMHRPGFVENDPVARPFERSRVGNVAGNAAGVGVEIGSEWWLRKHGHRRLARVMEIAVIGGHATGIATTLK